MGLHAPLGAAELGPGKEIEAEGDGSGVEGQQSVLEAELVFLGAQAALAAKALQRSPEQVFIEFGGPVCVGVGEGRLVGCLGNAQVGQLAKAACEAVADLAKGVGVGHLAEEHGDELSPTGKAFGVAFALVLLHQLGELVTRKLIEQLTEETRGPYHNIALRCCVGNQVRFT